jgi:hypothetical protein
MSFFLQFHLVRPRGVETQHTAREGTRMNHQQQRPFAVGTGASSGIGCEKEDR